MITLKKPNKTLLLIGIGLIVAGVSIAIVTSQVAHHAKTTASSSQKGPNTPDFQALLPSGKSITQLGGWQKLTPPNNQPYYVFVDSIDGIGINVSQQELPASFKDGTDTKVSELAKAYNATDTFTVKDTKVYIGTSAKGPQSVIFTKNGLLIFIKSQKQLTNDAWSKYITSLT